MGHVTQIESLYSGSGSHITVTRIWVTYPDRVTINLDPVTVTWIQSQYSGSGSHITVTRIWVTYPDRVTIHLGPVNVTWIQLQYSGSGSQITVTWICVTLDRFRVTLTRSIEATIKQDTFVTAKIINQKL